MECEETELDKVRESIRRYDNVNMKVYCINEDTFKGLPIRSFYSLAIYSRFLIPSVLTDVDKALYLDLDVIVNGGLEELWQTDLKNYSCAGVNDLRLEFTRPKSSLGYDQLKEGYINTGVMLINVGYWREHNITTKLFDFAKNTPAPELLDQGVINMLLHGTIKILDPKWNFTTGYYAYPPMCIDEYKKYIRPYWHKAIIHHFVGPVKEWHLDSGNPNTYLYRRYRKETPWKDVPLKWHAATPAKGRYLLIMRKLKNIVAYVSTFFYRN